ncbi:MAG: DoxX family membrane protein [Candidatus Kapabacteria bacterium]|nr:DoxX family membrane protein [Ignavibacteriota bacterium]MCW5886085.1 DoxX family membrane protein [Candidatus Kapabacteria bacterium]
MKKILDNPYIILIARIILGYIFITYGAGKISNPEKFASEIANFALVPEFTLNILALILPWVEFLAGVFILFGIRLKSSSIITGGLMILFVFSVAWAMAMGLDINCGCSSTNPQKVGLPKLLENVGLFTLSLYIFLFPNKRFSLESFTE